MIINKRPFKKRYQDFESIKNILAPLLSIVRCPGVFLGLLCDILARSLSDKYPLVQKHEIITRPWKKKVKSN